MKKWNELEWQW